MKKLIYSLAVCVISPSFLFAEDLDSIPEDAAREFGAVLAKSAAKMAGKYGRRSSKYSRAQQWMDENPSDDEIVAFLEEYQRNLEQKIEDVRTRIEDIKRKKSDD